MRRPRAHLRSILAAVAFLALALAVIVQSVRLNQALIREQQLRAEAEVQAWGDPDPGQRTRGLVEGPVTIANERHDHYGLTGAVLRKVWRYGEGQDNRPDLWLSQRHGGRPPLYLRVGGTRCSLVIVEGTVTPLLLVDWPAPGCYERLWRFEGRGIEQLFEDVRYLGVGGKIVQLSPDVADAAYTLTLDFRRGFEMS